MPQSADLLFEPGLKVLAVAEMGGSRHPSGSADRAPDRLTRSGRRHHGARLLKCLEFDGRELVETVLPAPTVVGLFDQGDDLPRQLLAGRER